MILWPTKTDLDHKSISVIEVTVNSDTALRVKAIGNGIAVIDEILIEGKDFHLEDGKISLPSKTEAGVLGGVLVGSSISTNKIGLDKTGHGKFNHIATAAGLAYLFVPIVLSETREVQFHRIEK